MTNKTDAEILADAPELDDLVTDITGAYFDAYGNYLTPRGVWGQSDASPVHPRSIADIKELVAKDKRIAELEKEFNDYASAFHQLKSEFVICESCGEQSECKDFDIFNGGTVDWLQHNRDLNMKAEGIESLITADNSIERSSMNSHYRREANKLREQAKGGDV